MAKAAEVTKVAGVIFIALIGGVVVLSADLITNSDYTIYFAKELSVGVHLAILALNVAVVTFLLGQLIPLEEKLNMNFNSTRNELKQNIYFMAGVVFTNMIVAASVGLADFRLAGISGHSFLGGLSISLTFLLVLAMLEIVNVVIDFKGARNQP